VIKPIADDKASQSTYQITYCFFVVALKRNNKPTTDHTDKKMWEYRYDVTTIDRPPNVTGSPKVKCNQPKKTDSEYRPSQSSIVDEKEHRQSGSNSVKQDFQTKSPKKSIQVISMIEL
jgi:hypothetical protein